MRLQRLSFCRQGAVHVHSFLQQRVEHRHQRRLVVVPPQAELLIVVHGAFLPLAAPSPLQPQQNTFQHTINTTQ